MLQPWFADAKFGIFLHWGIYAVKGISESWSFYNGTISYDDYMSQFDGFTAEHYDPQAWARLFKESGARYAVLTAKHHDGVALWDTGLSDLSVVKKSPAQRDLIGPYCDALRTEKIKVGIYFSHLDWSHPDYASVFPHDREAPLQRNKFSLPPGDTENPEGWKRFIEFHRGQLKELTTRYHPELLWFDGDWERDDEQWNMKELRDQLHRWSPGVVLNSRMRGYGDYKTPEQAIPIVAPEGPWEFCMTMNNSWGFQHHDTNYKSVRQLVQILTECIGMGGNLLLDIGPRPDGTIPQEAASRLAAIGSWIRKHEEAVYATIGGLPHGHFYGPTSLSKDRTRLYLYVFDTPRGEISLKGLRSKIVKMRVVGTGAEVSHRRVGGASWLNIPGVEWITLPPAQLDEHVTVIACDLDGPINFYHGSGGAIEQN